jgi:hypothetical protein
MLTCTLLLSSTAATPCGGRVTVAPRAGRVYLAATPPSSPTVEEPAAGVVAPVNPFLTANGEAYKEAVYTKGDPTAPSAAQEDEALP